MNTLLPLLRRFAVIAVCLSVLAWIAFPEFQQPAGQFRGQSRSSVPMAGATGPPPGTLVGNIKVKKRTGAPFLDITDAVGLDFEHAVGPLGTYFTPEVNGTGGAMFDFDNDGDLDIYLVNSGRSPRADGEFPAELRTENRLYRQEADGRFVDVTAASGLGDTGYGIGCAVGDIDNDGDLDVYLTNYGADQLYENQGDGTFRNVTQQCGIDNREWSTCAAFFDYDRDGRLDLVVSNYTADPVYGHSIACGLTASRVSYCGPHKFSQTIDRLYHNDGSAADAVSEAHTVRFSDVTEQSGLSTGLTAGFGVICADFNRDRWPDVYVASDMTSNRLWINQHDGTFRDEAVVRGVAVSGSGLSQGSMGVGLGDIDGDDDLDVVVTNLATEAAIVYADDGTGVFTDVTPASGLRMPTRPHTGWGVALVDLDHDGDLDVPIVNGLVVPGGSGFPPHGEDVFRERHDRVVDPLAYWDEYVDDNLLLMNDGQGNFDDQSLEAGDFTATLGSGRALITGDIDNDGDMDLLVTYCGGKARLYRNDMPKVGHWLKVRAVDARYGRDAYGAEVIVTVGGRSFRQLVQPAMSYLASNDVRVHFGLGQTATYDEIIVHWPDGTSRRYEGGPTDRLIELSTATGHPVQEKQD